MITFFTTGKAFTGYNGVIQRNALKSWTMAAPDAEVILFGDEEGAAETARELGIKYVAKVERADFISSGFISINPETQGPKILRSFFDEAQRMARHEVVCYANCDIVLMEDFAAAAVKVGTAQKQFLMVGRRWDTQVAEPIEFAAADWKKSLWERARATGQQRSGDWIDYFVFRKGFFWGQMPEMVIGRVYWDQWMVWKAREMGAAVVDASEAVMAIHQNHDYGYHPAGKTGVWTDELARRNYELAGGRWHLRTIDDATHVLGPGGLEENPARRRRAAARILKTAKEAAWMAAMDWTRPARRRIQEKRKAATPNGPG
jgi:hypothetical protein